MTGPRPARTASTTLVHRGRRRHDVVAVDRDVVDAVAGGPSLERRRVLGRRPARTRRSRCSRRRRSPAAATPRRGSPPRGTRPAPPRRRRRTRPRRCRRRGAAPPSPRPTAIGRPAATMPLAPKMPSVGSAMCIEPPRPRLVPCVLAHQLGEHPERVEALGQAVAVAAVGRGDHVGRAAAASTRRRPTPPARSRGARSRAPRRRGRARPPAPRSRGSRSIRRCISSRSAVENATERVDGHRPCIVLVGTT